MKIILSPAAPDQVEADVLAIPVVAGRPLAAAAAAFDRQAGGLLTEILSRNEHRGRLMEIMPVHLSGPAPTRRVLLYGLGSLKDMDGQRMRWAHHEMVRAARNYGFARIAILRCEPLEESDLAAVVEGAVMGTWEQRGRTSNQADRTEVTEIALVGFGLDREREVVAALQMGEATNRARELQVLPPNVLTPEALAEEARRLGRRHGLEVEILGPEELKAGGYNLIMGVTAGSAEPPRMIRISATRGPEGGRRLALVGKGITFDSGGLSIKPATGMLRMKGDMGGAAAVLSAMDVIAARQLDIDVTAIIPTCENMPSATAQRPGDVIVSANGKTVEILNTDAEGRLVLGDALTHAVRHGATHIVDLATLTGAATVALGHAATATLCDNDELWNWLAGAAERAGDRVWRLPLYPDYRVLIQSKYADIRNSEYGEAGVITGGMFIQEFADGRPWAHLDIAASSWNTNGDLTTIPRGPTGAGTRVCVELAEAMAAAGGEDRAQTA